MPQASPGAAPPPPPGTTTQHAIADLTRACELAPAEASYFYERGLAHGQNKEPDLALADFDAAIKLKPDDVAALVARASVRAGRHRPGSRDRGGSGAGRPCGAEGGSGAHAHGLCVRVHRAPPGRIVQFSKWIEARERGDVHMSNALNARCWARAWWGQELEQALADCNAALKLSPNTAAYLDSRGLVYLRQNQYDKAIADYDAALRLQPEQCLIPLRPRRRPGAQGPERPRERRPLGRRGAATADCRGNEQARDQPLKSLWDARLRRGRGCPRAG